MHTPGPWEAELESDDRVDGTEAWGECYQIYSPASDGIVGFCLNESDAHLIAAAPELLAALEAVVRIADRKTVEFDAARAAISKAKGE